MKIFGGKIVLEQPRLCGIKIGFEAIGCFDPKGERAVWHNHGTIIFKGTAWLGSGTRISNDGILEFGNNCSISANSTVICKNNILFGDECLISWDCLFMDSDLHQIRDDSGKVINLNKKITIGNHVWVGCRCLVLKGAQIADGNIVAAGSMIKKIYDENNKIVSTGGVSKDNVYWFK